MKGEREAGLNAGTSGLRWWSRSSFFLMQSKKFQNKEGQTTSQRRRLVNASQTAKEVMGQLKANMVTQQDGARDMGL